MLHSKSLDTRLYCSNLRKPASNKLINNEITNPNPNDECWALRTTLWQGFRFFTARPRRLHASGSPGIPASQLSSPRVTWVSQIRRVSRESGHMTRRCFAFRCFVAVPAGLKMAESSERRSLIDGESDSFLSRDGGSSNSMLAICDPTRLAHRFVVLLLMCFLGFGKLSSRRTRRTVLATFNNFIEHGIYPAWIPGPRCWLHLYQNERF